MVTRAIRRLAIVAWAIWTGYHLLAAIRDWWLGPATWRMGAWAADPDEPTFRLRIGLTPAEVAAARERERETVMLG